MKMFSTGDRVLLKVRRGRKEEWLVATFQAMQSRSRVIVLVDDPKAPLTDDGIRLVDMKSIKPYYNHPTDQQRRARHAVRQYKQGVRIFRLDSPTGHQFCLDTLDIEQGIAVGHVAKRKTVKVVPLHSLFPALR